MFYKREGGLLIGVAVTYMDDTLQCGNKEFMKLAERTTKSSNSQDRELDRVTSSGKRIEKSGQGFEISQPSTRKSGTRTEGLYNEGV